MQYNQEVAEKMLADPRWEGAIQQKMLKVWKTRGTIPNQYFNPRYVELTKKNDPAANQVKDPFFNESFILKSDLTPAEEKEHDRLIYIIRKNEKLRGRVFCEQCGISYNLLNDASREKTDKRFVYMRPEHVLALKKGLQELRIKVKTWVEEVQDRRVFRDTDVAKMDALIRDQRFHVMSLLGGNKLYAGRISARKSGTQTYYDEQEIRHNIDKLAIFLIETAI